MSLDEFVGAFCADTCHLASKPKHENLDIDSNSFRSLLASLLRARLLHDFRLLVNTFFNPALQVQEPSAAENGAPSVCRLARLLARAAQRVHVASTRSAKQL